MSWPVVNLGDLATFINGDRGKNYPSKGSFVESGIPFINAGNLESDGTLTKSFNYITKDKFESLRSGKVIEGDLLFCLRGSLGKYAVVRGIPEGAIASSLVIIRIGNEVELEYLKHYLGSRLCKQEIEQFENGAAQPNLSATDVKKFKIPLPPLDEQKRIAAILDKADAIRRKRQQAIQFSDDFLKSVFLDMFGDYFTTEGYTSSKKKKISDLVDYIDYRGKTPKKSESGVRLITAKNVKSGYVSLEPEEFIPEENYIDWMTRGLPSEGDVLFTTEAPLGNAALLPKFEKVVVGQRLIALRAKGELTQEYLLYCLLNPFIQDEIYRRSSGSTVKGIRTKELYQIEIPIPQIDQQKSFSEIYHKHTANKLKLFESAKKTNQFFDSLSQKAFAGEL